MAGSYYSWQRPEHMYNLGQYNAGLETELYMKEEWTQTLHAKTADSGYVLLFSKCHLHVNGNNGNIFIVEKRLVLKTKDNEILKNKISLSPFFFLFSVFLYQPLQVVLNLQYS